MSGPALEPGTDAHDAALRRHAALVERQAKLRRLLALAPGELALMERELRHLEGELGARIRQHGGPPRGELTLRVLSALEEKGDLTTDELQRLLGAQRKALWNSLGNLRRAGDVHQHVRGGPWSLRPAPPQTPPEE